MDPYQIIYYFYPEDSDLRELLLKHSGQVKEKALQIAEINPEFPLNREILISGAVLHDIGIKFCHAPDIFCNGNEHYIRHGIIGAEMLREYGKKTGMDLECYAGICERHTGSGLTADEIRSGKLPLPFRDFLPETLEEKVICLADKFYSKSGDCREKPMEKILHSMAKFGEQPLFRFEKLAEEFHLNRLKK